MMQSQYSDSDVRRALQTLRSVAETIEQLTEWNKHIAGSDDYYLSQTGLQLLAANCTLITAIGEGYRDVLKTSVPRFRGMQLSGCATILHTATLSWMPI